MATKLQIKRTSVSGRTPNTSDPANTSFIATGELALNLTDKKLFSSNGTAYFEVGSNLQSITTESITVGNNATNTFANSTTLRVGDNIVLNDSNISVGNSSINSSLTSTTLNVKSITANGSLGQAGDVLFSNSTGIYWATANAIGGADPNASYTWTNVHTFSSNVIVNGVFVSNNNALFNGTITLGDASSDNITFLGSVNSFIIPASNLTYSLGNNSLYWLEVHTGNVHADQGFFEFDVEIKNDLVVEGNTSLVNGLVNGFITVGNSTVNTIINSTSISTTNLVATNLSGNGALITSVTAATVGGNTASDLRSYSDTKAGDAYTNATSFASNATNISSGTLGYARLGPNVVNTTSNFTFTGVHTHSANVRFDGAILDANGTMGANQQLLVSNGTATYWSSKFYSGALPPEFPNYGDVWLWTDEYRLFMWVNDGAGEYWFDFLPLNE